MADSTILSNNSKEHSLEINNLKGDNSRIIMDRVIPFIKNSLKEDKSFFSTIWFHTPHLPVVSDSLHRSYHKDFNLREQIYYGAISAMDEQIGRLWKIYYGAISAMDEQIGRLWKKLKEHGIQEETIIFFCSDNGPQKSTPDSAGIFRGKKESLYEGGVRVPAFVVWKNHLEGGRRIDFPTVTSDYMPTILDILDIEYPAKRPIDGISLLDVLKGRKKKKERDNPIGFICKSQVSWLTHQYKLIGDKELENFELYDLLNDQPEKKNIREEFPKLTDELKADLFEWLNSVENSKKGKDY